MQKKYEEYAYVLAYEPRGKSKRVRGREGLIIQAIGERYLTLLELLGIPSINIEVGERVYIGREGRTKILNVLGKLEYNELGNNAKSKLPYIIKKCGLDKLVYRRFSEQYAPRYRFIAPETYKEFERKIPDYLFYYIENNMIYNNIYEYLHYLLIKKLHSNIWKSYVLTGHGHGSKPTRQRYKTFDYLDNNYSI